MFLEMQIACLFRHRYRRLIRQWAGKGLWIVVWNQRPHLCHHRSHRRAVEPSHSRAKRHETWPCHDRSIRWIRRERVLGALQSEFRQHQSGLGIWWRMKAVLRDCATGESPLLSESQRQRTRDCDPCIFWKRHPYFLQTSEIPPSRTSAAGTTPNRSDSPSSFAKNPQSVPIHYSNHNCGKCRAQYTLPWRDDRHWATKLPAPPIHWERVQSPHPRAWIRLPFQRRALAKLLDAIVPRPWRL